MNLLTAEQSNEATAFMVHQFVEATKAAAHFSALAKQNEKVANDANKAADELAKQLKDAKEQLDKLQPPAPPAPAPEPTAEQAPLPAAAEPVSPDAP